MITALILWLATVSVFWQVKDHSFFTMDDPQNTFANPGMNPPSVEGVIGFWKQPYFYLYIPVAYTAWSLEMALARQYGSSHQSGIPDLRYFHLANVFVHATNVVLLYLILDLLFDGSAMAALGALFFAWHPMQVEPVAWISCHRDLLSACFGLLSTWFYLRFLRKKGEEGRFSRAWYVSALLCFVLGILSKPSLAALPLGLVAMEVGLLRRPWRTSLLRLSPWLIPVAVIIYMTRSTQPIGYYLATLTWAERLRVACDTLGFYFVKYCAPIGLVFDYGRTPAFVLRQGSILFCLVPVGLAGLAVLDRERRFWLSAFGVYLGGILPVLGLIPFAFQNFSTVSDRYSYFAMLALALIATRLCLRWKRPWAGVGLALFLVACCLQTFAQSRFWKDTETLLSYSLRKNPNGAITHEAIGNVLLMRGMKKEAVVHLKEAARLDDTWPLYRYVLATRLKNLGRRDEAKAEYSELVRRFPQDLNYQLELAQMELETGNQNAAKEPLKRIVALEPSARAYSLLGISYFESGARLLSIQTLAEGARRFPENSKLFLNWATALERSGEERRALDVYRKMLDKRPDEEARKEMGRLLGKLGRWDEAAEQYRKLILFSGQTPLRLSLLGEALFRSGHRTEARQEYEAALRLKPGYGRALRALDEIRSGRPNSLLANQSVSPGWFDTGNPAG
jgi:tetratricopeptide (TPR) repeat protein